MPGGGVRFGPVSPHGRASRASVARRHAVGAVPARTRSRDQAGPGGSAPLAQRPVHLPARPARPRAQRRSTAPGMADSRSAKRPRPRRPWARNGRIGWAASASSVTRPAPQGRAGAVEQGPDPPIGNLRTSAHRQGCLCQRAAMSAGGPAFDPGRRSRRPPPRCSGCHRRRRGSAPDGRRGATGRLRPRMGSGARAADAGARDCSPGSCRRWSPRAWRIAECGRRRRPRAPPPSSRCPIVPPPTGALAGSRCTVRPKRGAMASQHRVGDRLQGGAVDDG
jgi:hypothetical protein